MRRLVRSPEAIAASLLFVFVFLYRFNALGGTFAGFDNEHFLHFVYAEQVAAGAQPLRDFLDGGLQGARPSLTYELSAAAQRLLGDNLRSEALLTVAGVSAAAVLTFLAANSIAPLPWALGAALLAAFTAPKLYNYPKALMLAAACLIIVRYARAPRRTYVVAMAVSLAVAFLFRHDYAIYCGVGYVAVVAAVHGRRVAAGGAHLAACGLLAALMLTPSLVWIESYAGLGQYFQNAVEMGRRETQRTDLAWPLPAFDAADSLPTALAREENTQAWIYYLFLAIPVIAVVQQFRSPGDDARTVRRGAVIGLAVMTLVTARYFLRGSLEARFGDIAPPVAVLGAVLLAWCFAPATASSRAWYAVRVTAAVLVLTVTIGAIAVLHSVRHELAVAGLSASPVVVVQQAVRFYRELATLPASVREGPQPSPTLQAAQYVSRCTQPSDRVLVATFAPEILAFADRRFAGGRATIVPGFYLEDRYAARTFAWLRKESVPLVLAEVEEDYYEEFPRLTEYLRAYYVDAGRVRLDDGNELRVLARRSPPPAGTHHGLPCFA